MVNLQATPEAGPAVGPLVRSEVLAAETVSGLWWTNSGGSDPIPVFIRGRQGRVLAIINTPCGLIMRNIALGDAGEVVANEAGDPSLTGCAKAPRRCGA